MFSVLLEDIEYTLKPKAKTDSAKILSKAYIEFLKVSGYKKAKKLSLWHPGVDYVNLMQPGTQPPARPFYSMSRDKLEVLKKSLKKHLSKRYI